MAVLDARFKSGKEKSIGTQSSHRHQLVRVTGYPRAFFNDSAFFEIIGIMIFQYSFWIKLIWLNVSHDVNLVRLLHFVLELFLANTSLHAFKWVIQTSGQTTWFK